MLSIGSKLVDLDQAQRATKIYRESITAYFRDLRKAKGWTQSDLADRLGVTVATVKSTESGRTRWNDENLFRFAAALDADSATILRVVADLMEGNEAEQVDPLRAQLVDIYDRRSLGDMMQMLGTLAKTWHPDEI